MSGSRQPDPSHENTNENGQISIGDLLTTSSTPGYAMKFELLEFDQNDSFSEIIDKLNENEKRRNSIIGKALEPFDGLYGTVEVFINLH